METPRNSALCRVLWIVLGVVLLSGIGLGLWLVVSIPLSGKSKRNPDCIYTERALRDVIDAGGEGKLCQVCESSDIVTLSSEIDISGKNFSLSCLPNDKCYTTNACAIEGTIGVGSRLFSGEPTLAKFDTLQFRNGEADEGGAFHLTGGTTEFDKCEFNYNTATAGDGGALYVAGGSTTVTLRKTGETTFNSASSQGGFLLATDNATVILDSTKDIGISWSSAGDTGGFVAALNGATVEVRSMQIECGKQAQNGGDYFFVADDATVECENVTFQVLASDTADVPPPLFNTTSGIVGNSVSCKSSPQVGGLVCKRQSSDGFRNLE